MNRLIHTILVPKGAEHQAVCRGLRQVSRPPTVIPMPIGTAAAAYLRSLHQAGDLVQGQSVVLMGVCGGLIPQLPIGRAVLYRTCILAADQPPPPLSLTTDPTFTGQLQTTLEIPLVNAVTSDRVITTPNEKHQLAQAFTAEVVDMEGYPVLEILTQIGVTVAMLRTISDDSHHSIPNLSQAISPEGTLRPVPLAISLLRQPIAASHLIRGSLRGLKGLQTITATLFSGD